MLFGLNPALIQQRCARLTYGVEITQPFRAVHDMARRFTHPETGQEFCRQVFNIFVQKGQLVEADYMVEQKLTKLLDGQTEATLKIFSSTEPNPMYVDEPGCTHVATVSLPMGHESKTLIVEFLFGGTEIRVRGVETRTGREVVTVINFAREAPAAAVP